MDRLDCGSAALRGWLSSNRITHAEFGERIGRAQTTVDAYATGKCPPPDIAALIETITGGEVSTGLWVAQLDHQSKLSAAHALIARSQSER
jgi:hypothetical protein